MRGRATPTEKIIAERKQIAAKGGMGAVRVEQLEAQLTRLRRQEGTPLFAELMAGVEAQRAEQEVA